MDQFLESLASNREFMPAVVTAFIAILAPILARFAQGLGGDATDVGRRRVEAETARIELLMKMRQLTEATPTLTAEDNAEMTSLVSGELSRLRSLVRTASTPDTRFEAIKDMSWWRRYFVLPMPKGVWSWILSFLYFYLLIGIVISPFMMAMQVFIFTGAGIDTGLTMFFTLAIVVALYVLIAAVIRRSLFSMRRRYEGRRVRKFSILR